MLTAQEKAHGDALVTYLLKDAVSEEEEEYAQNILLWWTLAKGEQACQPGPHAHRAQPAQRRLGCRRGVPPAHALSARHAPAQARNTFTKRFVQQHLRDLSCGSRHATRGS